MNSFEAYFTEYKKQRRRDGLWRTRQCNDLKDFCSNDYLGFNKDKTLSQRILDRACALENGSGSSPLIRGYSKVTSDLESQLAQRSQTEASLFFKSGYLANLSFFSAFKDSGFVFFSDRDNHASIIDGLRLSGCKKVIFNHNSLFDLEHKLKSTQHTKKIVVVESIYSMSGDYAPLTELSLLCERNHALLVVDEAHGTGYFGENGTGRVESLKLIPSVFARVHTAGKALGVGGAWVSGSRSLAEFMVNRSRPYIYSTASHPLAALRLKLALGFWDEVGAERVLVSQKRIEEIRSFTDEKSSLVTEVGPIISMSFDHVEHASTISREIATRGFDVKPIRPPTVPGGTSLLRITVPLYHSDETISEFCSVLKHKKSFLQDHCTKTSLGHRKKSSKKLEEAQ